ncbi:transposase IS200 like protein [bacterium BMS3Bbin10]|nr:transposase IS200 like protein [bacterium BMS3Bbin10]
MARLARIVIPGIPHHVTQRGNRREQVFFEPADYRAYLDFLGASAGKSNTSVIAYCLMPNHVHLILLPDGKDGLRATLADTHRRYTGRINARNKWTGHLWQGRFGSVAMDEDHLYASVRYVSLNPVRARLVSRAEDWEWSSVRAHLAGVSDGVVDVAPVLERFPDFAAMLTAGEDDVKNEEIRKAETVGRPLGNAEWIQDMERLMGRTLTPKKRGPKPRTAGN